MSGMPKQINELIERFDRNIESYRNQAYNETQARREFVDPLFEALGWDVTNRAGYAEYLISHKNECQNVKSSYSAWNGCYKCYKGGMEKWQK